jgi:hypothetical protein
MPEATELVEQHGIPCFDHDAIDVCHGVPLQSGRVARSGDLCRPMRNATVSPPPASGQSPNESAIPRSSGCPMECRVYVLPRSVTRPRPAPGNDPNLPVGLLQSGPTASHDFSCFASTKRPFAISHTRPSADVYGNRAGDGTRLTAAGQVLRPNDSRHRNLPFVVLRGDRPLHLQQRPINRDGPDEGPNGSSPPGRRTRLDPEPPATIFQPTDRSPRFCLRAPRQLNERPLKGSPTINRQDAQRRLIILLATTATLTQDGFATRVRRSTPTIGMWRTFASRPQIAANASVWRPDSGLHLPRKLDSRPASAAINHITLARCYTR